MLLVGLRDLTIVMIGLHYSSDSKTQWSDSESVDTNQLITDSSVFTRNFAGTSFPDKIAYLRINYGFGQETSQLVLFI